MSGARNPLRMGAGERGGVRVFALSMTEAEVKALNAPDALARALGAGPVDMGRVEIFPLSNLEGLGLAGYLVEGCGVPKAQVAPDRRRLDALEGSALIVFSKAFGDKSVTLSPAPALTLIGAYVEDRPDWKPEKIATESAKPFSAPPRRAPRKMRGEARRAGAIVFATILALMALLLYGILT